MTNYNDRNYRKQEFLDVALELFYAKGYEKTTINDIIKKVGVSKGAFYHYFDSKEDVIETIAVEYVDKMVYIAEKTYQRKDLNAIEKLNISISEIQQHKKKESTTRIKIKGAFNSDENLKLQKKVTDKIKDKILPTYQKIIDEGVKEKLFSVSNSKEMAELFLAIAQELNTSINELKVKAYEKDNFNREEFIKNLDKKLSFYEEIFERIFKLPEGSVKLREAFMERF